MTYLYIFIAGFVAAALGTAPPGLLNMTAGKIAYEFGSQKSNRFIGGVALVSAIYSFTATQFSFYIDSHPDVVTIIYKIGVLIFGVLTLYFFLKGWHDRRRTVQADLDRNNFILSGMFLALLNILPIPFYTATALFMAQNGMFNFYPSEILTLVLSVVSGTIVMLKIYTVLYPKISHKNAQQSRGSHVNSNYIIAVVTFLVMLTAILKLL